VKKYVVTPITISIVKMKIAFDLDDTLIPTNFDFSVGSKYLKYPLRHWFKEPLREGTVELLKELSKDHQIWIYTSSLRSRKHIWLWFRWWGVSLNGVINYKVHSRKVKGTFYQKFTKAPAFFKMDLLIDDSQGVKMECNQQGCRSLILDPADDNWTQTVKNALEEMQIDVNNSETS
jgi:hypothetical protein